VTGPCATLLVRRPGTQGKTGNPSDDEIDRYGYDVTFDNDQPLPEAEKTFCVLMDYLRHNYA
jgi:hypothetical protein